MTLEFWAITFDFIGKILLVVMALLVHKRVKKEKKIDRQVLKEMRLEQSVSVLALIMIIVGYILKLMEI